MAGGAVRTSRPPDVGPLAERAFPLGLPLALAIVLLGAAAVLTEAPPIAQHLDPGPQALQLPAQTSETVTIIAAQQRLRAAGFDPENTNGVVDEQTATAIRQFQQARGLRPTGKLDAETRAALLGRPLPLTRASNERADGARGAEWRERNPSYDTACRRLQQHERARRRSA